jgi:hypothetical protein
MSSVDDKRNFESQNCLKSSNYADRNFEENFKTPQKLGIDVTKLSASLTLLQRWSVRPLHVFQTSLTYEHGNGTACIIHQCRKTTVLSCHRCVVNMGVEKEHHLDLD